MSRDRLCYNIYQHARVNVLDKGRPEYSLYVAITYKECGVLIFLTPHTFWNTTDSGTKCEKCETINTNIRKLRT